MTDTIKIEARILAETDSAILVTQRPFGGRNGVWLTKKLITVEDRHAIQPHHIITLPVDMAAEKGLGPKMQESRTAPSPYGGTDQ